MEVKKKPACEGGDTDRERLVDSSGLNTVVLHCHIIFAEEWTCERGNWNTILLPLPISLLTVVCRIILPGTMCRQPLDKWLQSGNVTAIMSDTAGACWRANTVIYMGQTIALRGPQPDILAYLCRLVGSCKEEVDCSSSVEVFIVIVPYSEIDKFYKWNVVKFIFHRMVR